MSPFISLSFAFLILVLIGVLTRRQRTLRRRQQECLARQAELDEKVNRLSEAISANNANNANDQVLPALQLELQKLGHQVRDLQHESRKPSALAKHNPKRLRLMDEVLTVMLPIHHKLDRVLFPSDQPLDDLDWMHKLKNREFPYSITDEEGLILYKLIVDNQLKNGYEIATAFGYSSFFMGLAFQSNGGHLLSVDAYVEEAEEDFVYSETRAREHSEAIREAISKKQENHVPEGLKFARWGAEQLGLSSVVDYQVGFSPTDVDVLAQGRTFDFAFIDGGHFGKQPTKDVQAILPFVDPDRFLIVFHDTHCDSVAQAVHFACDQLSIPRYTLRTRNQFVVLSKGIESEKLAACEQLVIRQNA
ncbi:hypothetical protein CA13_41660 [Planctomycetes bacterium CA13]|uniref:Uncharacterized protein n=1 Tax=Novipirellula herctigrandis TaxID=2527986 RepID=A0A5C5Z855_9BACT|nr:hypothetical protein CA13_41660 [Planctomycetes bacterium CA13]